MQDFGGPFETGIVEDQLGADGNPVYTTSQTSTLTTTGKENFDQWYRDVSGVNLSQPLTITLTNSAANPAIYTHIDSSFFPIDNQLFGNEGFAHNYHFTFELHSRFTYQGGETFDFEGDDDVFVFINDHLVIDLGGVHGPLSASVDLDAVASSIDLQVGENYDLDFFFAERRCCGSNFKMQTTILLETDPDPDEDGVETPDDLCPDTNLGDAVDVDGCSDADVDGDGDGICDPGAPNAGPSGCIGSDICPDTAPGDAVDVEGCSDAQVDGDGDGICDPGASSAGPSGCTGSDNCPEASNPGQEDSDGDGVGDACPEGCIPVNVPELGQYSLVYSLPIPDDADFGATGVPYAVDNSGSAGPFDRVAYCLELDDGSGVDWVWVSMPAFTSDAAQTGVPVATTGAIFDQLVTDVNVFSNVAGVPVGTGVGTGSIEFWHHCYGTQTNGPAPGGNGSTYDFDDTISQASCYGSMQVHDWGAGTTIFAFNAWDEALSTPQPLETGIGPSPSGHPDWTFARNAPSYTERKELRVFVRPLVTDADGDGVGDPEDLCSGTATGDPVDANGCSDAQVDGDGDGVCDPNAASAGPSACAGSDNCPADANPGQEDLDTDDVGDVCDPDADGDGDPAVTDCNDLDPSVFNGATEICTDGVDNDCDGLIDEQDGDADCDADGVPNDQDNCPLDFNDQQEDLDGDGLGDVCDDDIDGDGHLNDADNCPVAANPGQEDFDGDGAGDVCDSDADADGLDDATEDLCLFTTTDPDAGVPSKSLGKNRWAEMDGNAQFDTNGKNPTGRMFTIYSTGGCSCAQIIAICGYGEGHTKFGCSNSVMDWWTGLYDRAGEAPFQCKAD